MVCNAGLYTEETSLFATPKQGIQGHVSSLPCIAVSPDHFVSGRAGPAESSLAKDCKLAKAMRVEKWEERGEVL